MLPFWSGGTFIECLSDSVTDSDELEETDFSTALVIDSPDELS